MWAAKPGVAAKIAAKANPNLVEVYSYDTSRREGQVTDEELASMNPLLGEKYLGDGARA